MSDNEKRKKYQEIIYTWEIHTLSERLKMAMLAPCLRFLGVTPKIMKDSFNQRRVLLAPLEINYTSFLKTAKLKKPKRFGLGVALLFTIIPIPFLLFRSLFNVTFGMLKTYLKYKFAKWRINYTNQSTEATTDSRKSTSDHSLTGIIKKSVKGIIRSFCTLLDNLTKQLFRHRETDAAKKPAQREYETVGNPATEIISASAIPGTFAEIHAAMRSTRRLKLVETEKKLAQLSQLIKSYLVASDKSGCEKRLQCFLNQETLSVQIIAKKLLVAVLSSENQVHDTGNILALITNESRRNEAKKECCDILSKITIDSREKPEKITTANAILAAIRETEKKPAQLSQLIKSYLGLVGETGTPEGDSCRISIKNLLADKDLSAQEIAEQLHLISKQNPDSRKKIVAEILTLIPESLKESINKQFAALDEEARKQNKEGQITTNEPSRGLGM